MHRNLSLKYSAGLFRPSGSTAQHGDESALAEVGGKAAPQPCAMMSLIVVVADRLRSFVHLAAMFEGFLGRRYARGESVAIPHNGTQKRPTNAFTYAN